MNVKRRSFLWFLGFSPLIPSLATEVLAAQHPAATPQERAIGHEALLAALPEGPLREGDRGEAVRALEAVLLARGFKFGGRENGPTGVFDRELRNILTGYQDILVEKGFLVLNEYTPGQYNANTRAAILKDFEQRKQAHEASGRDVIYDCGNKNAALRRMQADSQPRGLFPANVTPNGIYGPATELAVLRIQKAAQTLGLLGEGEAHGIYTKNTQGIYRKHIDIVTALKAAEELEQSATFPIGLENTGNPVKIAERALFYRGFRFGRGVDDFKPTGKSDSKMQDAVRQYQAILMKKDFLPDMDATGEIDAAMIVAIKQDLRQIAQVFKDKEVVLWRGDSGLKVAHYQRALVESGIYGDDWYPPNGIFGPYTELGTLGLQIMLAEQDKLPPDEVHGIYTKATERAFHEYLGTAAPRVTERMNAPVKTPALLKDKITIVLDPGHGTLNISPTRGKPYDSFDIGARISHKGANDAGIHYEYQAVELFTADLLEAFKKYPGVEIKLTRDIQKESEAERRQKKNAVRRYRSRTEVKGDLFLSVHVNSLKRGTAQGPRIFVHGKKDHHPLDRSRNARDRWAWQLKDTLGVHSVQEKALDVINPGLQAKGRLAALLIETGFVCSTADMDKLVDPAWRKETADKIAEATVQFAIEEKLAREETLRGAAQDTTARQFRARLDSTRTAPDSLWR